MADYPLIFTRQLKSVLGLEESYTAQDTRLKLAIATASHTIENLLGRNLTKKRHVEYVASKRNANHVYDVYGMSQTGYGSTYKTIPLYLKHYPIDESETFEVYYDPGERYEDGHKLQPHEYILDAERGVLIIKRSVGSFKRGLKVVYTAGYEASVDTEGGVVEDPSLPQEKSLANSLPVDLQQAALWQAQIVYEKQYSGNINVRESRGEGSSNTTRYVNIHGVAPETMAIIVQNRRPRHSYI